MNPLLRGLMGPSALLLLLLVQLLGPSWGQLVGDECLDQFKKGREDFILEADESVKDGAEFLSSPKLERYKDCVVACCKEPKCNVAFMEAGAEEGLVNSCFLFNCMYKQKYVCRFVRKAGYLNYIQDTIYENYIAEDSSPDVSDHPPVANGGQDLVAQPQDFVTLNGMKSKDDHGISTFQWQMLTEYPYAVIEKTNYDDQIIVSNLTSGVYKFRLTVVDTIGQSDSTKVTVLVLTPEQSQHHCMAPKKAGPCRGSFPRWHYNAASGKCEEFSFGGCRGNLNNYLSQDECHIACSSTTESNGISGRGLPVPAPQGEKCGGPCSAEQFTCESGCCLDPGLECDKTPQCGDGSDEKKCEYLDSKFRILLQIPVNEQKVRCTELPDTGDCRDTYTKWYYSPNQQACLRFNYGGCKGNENRFDTHDACMRVCRGVTEKDVFARKNDAEKQIAESNTGILAIAVLLGVAILILLGVLGYCLVKGKKKTTHQRVPVNNTPVSFEDRERLVYNSTTKPI